MSTPDDGDRAFQEFTPRRLFSSLFHVTHGVLLSPRRFFDEMPTEGRTGASVLYLLACYLILSIVNFLALAFLFIVPAAIIASSPSMRTGAAPELLVGAFFLLTVGLPLLSLLGFFLWIFVQYAFVLLVSPGGSARQGLGATARTCCYGSGATVLLACVPVAGFLASPYAFYLLVAGLKRVHGLSNARALASVLAPTVLSLALIWVAFSSASTAFGDSKSAHGLQASLFPDTQTKDTGYETLETHHPDHTRLRRLRADVYSQDAPRARYGVEVMVATNVPPGKEPKGIIGGATDSGHNSVYKGPADPARSVGEEGDEIRYVARFKQPENNSVGYGMFCQGFVFRGRGPFTVELDQVSGEWRTLYIRAYSALDSNAKESVGFFSMPYASVKPGDKLKLVIKPGEPYSDLLMRVDRNTDGEYEEAWIPDATISGDAANDSVAPVTTAIREKAPGGSTIALEHRDTGDPGDAASGIGVIYYYVNGAGPEIYSRPFPVENDDSIKYFSLDRAGNLEGMQETMVAHLPDGSES